MSLEMGGLSRKGESGAQSVGGAIRTQKTFVIFVFRGAVVPGALKTVKEH